MSNRNQYVEKMKLQIDELTAKMSEVEAKAKEAKADAQEKFKEQMADLRYQADLAASKLDELKAAGEESWGSLVTEMEKIRDAFKHSFRYFKSQM